MMKRNRLDVSYILVGGKGFRQVTEVSCLIKNTCNIL